MIYKHVLRYTPPTFFLTNCRPYKEKANFVDSILNYAKDASISKYISDSIGKFIQNSSIEKVSSIKNLLTLYSLELKETPPYRTLIELKPNQINLFGFFDF